MLCSKKSAEVLDLSIPKRTVSTPLKDSFPPLRYQHVAFCSSVNVLYQQISVVSCKGPLAPGCRYYNSGIHQAAFVLPEFARSALNLNSKK